MDLMTILLLIIILFPMLNYWIFEEAGVGGYKALIPFYNYFIWLQVIGKPWWWLLLMLVPFTVIVLQRALAIQAAQGLPFCAVRFDCGCGAGEVAICFKLVENTLLILLAALIVVARNERWTLRFSLFK